MTLIQTKKISKLPVVLYGKDFWTPFLKFVDETLVKKYKTIDKEDLELFHVVDTVDDAYEYIIKHVDPSTPRQV